MEKLIVIVVAGVMGLGTRVPSSWRQAATDGPNDYLGADSTFNQFVRDMYEGSDLVQDGEPEIKMTDYKVVAVSMCSKLLDMTPSKKCGLLKEVQKTRLLSPREA